MRQYDPGLLFPFTLITGLNILDSFFTMMILDLGGEELNPLVRAAMEQYGEGFWVWKYAIVSANLILLCFLSRFRNLFPALAGVAFVLLGGVLYQIALLHLGE